MGSRQRGAVGCLCGATDAAGSGTAGDDCLAREKYPHMDAFCPADAFGSAKGDDATGVTFPYGCCAHEYGGSPGDAVACGHARAAHRHAVPHGHGKAPNGHDATHGHAHTTYPDDASSHRDAPAHGNASTYGDACAAYADAPSHGNDGATNGHSRTAYRHAGANCYPCAAYCDTGAANTDTCGM